MKYHFDFNIDRITLAITLTFDHPKQQLQWPSKTKAYNINLTKTLTVTLLIEDKSNNINNTTLQQWQHYSKKSFCDQHDDKNQDRINKTIKSLVFFFRSSSVSFIKPFFFFNSLTFFKMELITSCKHSGILSSY